VTSCSRAVRCRRYSARPPVCVVLTDWHQVWLSVVIWLACLAAVVVVDVSEQLVAPFDYILKGLDGSVYERGHLSSLRSPLNRNPQNERHPSLKSEGLE
jgi:hypothetical protein